jgi:EAL domain-containing protein (putative c-di-GMP-specific phosphodiesterase class I)
MVIDDDPGICSLVSTVLGKMGVTSIGLPGINDLARALATTQPWIVFLDVVLDRSDAVDGIRVLRETGFTGAVQLISGKDQTLLDDIRSIGERSGLRMLTPLRKPFRSHQLKRIFRLAGAASNAREALVIAKAPEEDRRQAPRVPLAEALARGWIAVAYQPKVDLRQGTIVGVEALARVNHPRHGTLGPLSFLPDASPEELATLTEAVIEQSLVDWRSLAGSGRNLRFAINAPVSALTSGHLTEFIRNHRPMDSSWPGLIVEVTEDEAVREIDAVAQAAIQLHIYDTHLAIDDFGIGYSSFARLKELPFRELKLDRSYVQNCARDRFSAEICRSIIDLAHAAGAVCVAEGIESIADQAALLEMGCDFGQGYLFARPLALQDFSTLVLPKS